MIITLSFVFVDFITICILQGATHMINHMIIGTYAFNKNQINRPQEICEPT